MDSKTIERELNYVSGVLSDIETIDLPWTEYGIVSISYDWDAALDRLKEMQAEQLTRDQQAKYDLIVKRIRAQKDKILALDYTYPEID